MDKKDKQPKENRQKYPDPDECGKCKGTGAVEDMFGFLKMCPKCEGEGVIWK